MAAAPAVAPPAGAPPAEEAAASPAGSPTGELVPAEEPWPMDPREQAFVQLQAILAGLPMHGVPDTVSLSSCAVPVACAAPRRKAPPAPSCVERIQDVLEELCEEFPEHQEVLGRLDIVFSSLDVVCLADHEASRLFTAVRGSDRTFNPLVFPRDWSSNLRIAFGGEPHGRTAQALEEYRTTRQHFPQYTSYGCGHSLGGAVVTQLARYMEEQDGHLAFDRVDVFNMATAPFARGLCQLRRTELHVHRVSGDWASYGLSALEEPNLHTHPVKPHIPEVHSLKHFMPVRASERHALARSEAQLGARRLPEGGGLLSALSLLTACLGQRGKGAKESIAPQLLPLRCGGPDGELHAGSPGDSPPPVPAPPLPPTLCRRDEEALRFRSGSTASSDSGPEPDERRPPPAAAAQVDATTSCPPEPPEDVGEYVLAKWYGGDVYEAAATVVPVAFPPPSPRGAASPEALTDGQTLLARSP